MTAKELSVIVAGYLLTVRVTDGRTVEYSTDIVRSWCDDPMIWGSDLEAEELDAIFSDLPEDWLSVSQVKTVMAHVLDSDCFNENLAWFRDDAQPQIIKIAKRAPDGSKIVKLNGLYVRQHPDHPELYSLNDCHKSARVLLGGKWKGKAVNEWAKLTSSKKLITELDRIGGKTPNAFLKQTGGLAATTGTWACRELLYAYTEYLHPKLHLQILWVFANHEERSLEHVPTTTSNGVVRDEEWREHRAASKAAFAAFRAVNSRYGIHTPTMTNRIYEGMYGTNKQGVADRFNVPNDPLRDFLPVSELGKHTTAMELIRRGIETGKTADDKQLAYIQATAAGKFTAQMFKEFDAMTIADYTNYLK